LRLLFVHEVSYRKKVIFEMHEFPELLASRGHQVNFLEFDEGQKFWHSDSTPRDEVLNGRVYAESTIRLSRPFQFGIPGFDRLLVMFTVVPQLHKLFRNNSFDAVVLLAVPTYGLQTLWFAKRYKVPAVFRALDVSHKIRSSILSPIIKWFEKRIYSRVDFVSANNPAMAAYCEQLGIVKGQTRVHYPPLDLSHFQSATRDESLRESLGFGNGDRVLTYMGSFFYFSGLPKAIREFADCAKSNPRLKLLLIGGGEQDTELRKLVFDLGLEKQVVFTGFISYEDLPKYLNVADVALNTLESTLVANTALPNKVLQYLAAGLPVVSTKLDGLYAVLGSEASISWENNAIGVVRKAAELSDNELKSMLAVKTTRDKLMDFDPEHAVELFELDLQLLAGKARA
jgi:glycosyltransferase involved in cell wall biosynthesis